MNRKRNHLLLAAGAATLLWVMIPASLQAQTPDSTRSPADTLVLDLERSVSIALGQSPDIVRARDDEESARFAARSAALELYSPRIDLNLQTPSFQQSQNEQLIYDPDSGKVVWQWITTDNRRWMGDIALTQPLPTGGQFQLESSFYRRFFRSDLTDDQPLEYSSDWRLIFSQELLQGNLKRIARERAKLGLERARRSGLRTRSQLAFRVVEAYYTLIENSRELTITREDLEASRSTAQLARRKYDAGLIPEVEALQLDVEVAQKEAELASAESRYAGLLDRFRQTLGLDLDKPVKIVGEPTFDSVDVKLDSSVARALAKRDEIRLANLDVKLAKYSYSDAKRPWRPSGQLNAFYDLERRGPTADSAFSTHYRDYDVNRGVSFTVSVPLFSGGRRNAQVQQAEIALRRSTFERSQTEQQVVLDVRDAVRSLREARKRYEITLRSLKLAEASYNITRSRFENGQVTARVWIEAQLTLKRNRINALQALIDHQLAVARYHLAIGEPVVPSTGA